MDQVAIQMHTATIAATGRGMLTLTVSMWFISNIHKSYRKIAIGACILF
jgi:hypothetical protein